MNIHNLSKKELEALILEFLKEWKTSEMAGQMARDLAEGSTGGCNVKILLLHIYTTCSDWVEGYFRTLHSTRISPPECDSLVVLMLMEVFRIVSSFQNGKSQW